MSEARPRAVLLDAMGTLLRLEAPAPALREGLLRDHGLRVSEARCMAAARAEMGFYRRHHDEGRDPGSLHGLRVRCAAVLRDALGQEAEAVEPERLLPTLMAALRFSAFPDAAPALRALREEGMRLVVVSNWDSSLVEVLERTGLRALVDGAVASAEVGAAKPARAIFDAALARAGARARQAWHVGDSVEHDVRGALAAGITPILVRRDPGAARAGAPARGVRVVGSLGELTRAAP